MPRTRRLGRGVAVLATILALSFATPLIAHAQTLDGTTELDGIGNVVSYSLCAVGIALAKEPLTLIAAISYCWNLYRTAV